MSRDPRDEGSDDRPPSEDDLEARLNSLSARLHVRTSQSEPDGPKTSGHAGIGAGLRLGTEFVAGVLVGAGIGWFVDRFAGTAPFGMIVFLLLGFAAGVKNVIQAAGRLNGNRGSDGKKAE